VRWHRKILPRKDPGEPQKSAGTREYVARLHEESAERLERGGDAQGAEAERAAAAEERRTSPGGGR